MKKIFISISMLLLTQSVHAQLTPTENYIQSRTYLEAKTQSDANARQVETVQYFDGLGRPKQVVNVKASPLGRDVVTPIVYDGFGRQVLDYLPVPQGGTSNGAIVTDPLSNATQPNIYGSEKIYSEKILESSPLNRIQQQVQVGTDWANKPVKFQYEANTTGEVKKFITITSWPDGASLSKLDPATDATDPNSENGFYKSGQLYKNVVTDEDGNKTIEFKNGKGQTILVRKVLSATENADTYYVYNEYDQLVFVIPPLASASGSLDLSTLDRLCYQYRYDGKNRLVEKKLPSKGREYMVYDKADRLIMTQDANMRPSGKWLFTKYDKFSRVAYTGIAVIGAFSRAQVQGSTDYYINQGQPSVETRNQTGFTINGMIVYYGNSVYPVDVETLLSVNYYDTYPQGSPAITSPILGQDVLPQSSSNSPVSTKSLPTASFVKNIEDDNWTKNYTYYDTRGRAIATHSINHLGGYTRTESKLDFSGLATQIVTSHKRKTSDIGVKVNERFEYDNANRLTKHWHQVDDRAEQLLTENTYNEISQLTNKKVGNNLQSMDYAYNIRGWMTEINKNDMSMPGLNGKLFSYRIKYNQKNGTTNPDTSLFTGKNVKPMYNGNIAEVDWKVVEYMGGKAQTDPKRYSYAYDALNRLTAGYYQNPNNPWSKEHTEVMDYDLNGNITNLYRTSVMENATTATVIDKLTYNYSGNKLTSINDISTNPSGYEGGGNTISYDLNGNMTNMLDKQITGISYNFLNLPRMLDIGYDPITTQVKTNYRADGVKLRKENLQTSVGVAGTSWTKETTDYLDGFQYLNKTSSGGTAESFVQVPSETTFALEQQAFSVAGRVAIPPTGGDSGGIIKSPHNPELQFFPTAEGFYDYQKKMYIYQYRDHLGNVRVSFGRNNVGALEITDANDYYPFGMNHLKTGNAFFGQGSYKNYKYNGKELQETGMYDFGARFYMSDIGRWGVVDPLAEKLRRHTPYNYTVNNPIVNIDPDGMLSQSFIDDLWNKSGNNTTWTNDGNGNFSDGNGNSVSDGNPPYYRILMFGGADLDPTGKTSYGQVSSTTKYIAKNVKKDNTTVSYENWPYWANSKTKQSIIDGWANTLQEAYNNGDKIALYGYSQGGVGILEIQRALAKRGVPVELLLVVDPANGPKSDEVNTYVHWNVKSACGFYQTDEQTASLRSHGSPLMASPRNSTVVENVNDTGRFFFPPGQTNSSAVNHSNIDEFRRDTVVKLINQLTQQR